MLMVVAGTPLIVEIPGERTVSFPLSASLILRSGDDVDFSNCHLDALAVTSSMLRDKPSNRIASR
jgi:hypothetical protein